MRRLSILPFCCAVRFDDPGEVGPQPLKMGGQPIYDEIGHEQLVCAATLDQHRITGCNGRGLSLFLRSPIDKV